ncbi:MAG: hypothetical protein WBA77_04800 [Microcoleaceae cyanobacterium]
MKLKDLEFTELLGQSQIIGGIDENKVYINADLNVDVSAEFREPLVIYYVNNNDAISSRVKWKVPVIIIDNIDDVDDINTIDFTIVG